MSIKLHHLQNYLVKLQENPDFYIEEQVGRFHKDLKNMDARVDGMNI